MIRDFSPVCLLSLLLLLDCANNPVDSEEANSEGVVRAKLEVLEISGNTDLVYNLIHETYITVQPEEINEVRFTFNHPDGVYDLIISAQGRYPDKRTDLNLKRGENILKGWIFLTPLSAAVDSTFFLVTLKDTSFVSTFKKDALEFGCRRIERACMDEQLIRDYPEYLLDYLCYIYPNQVLLSAINYFIYKPYVGLALPMLRSEYPLS